MSRLIDADKIKLNDELPYKGSVKRVLAQAPTVETIPIEWINRAEKDKAYQMYDWSEILSIVYRWRKEQSNEVD